MSVLIISMKLSTTMRESVSLNYIPKRYTEYIRSSQTQIPNKDTKITWRKTIVNRLKYLGSNPYLAKALVFSGKEPNDLTTGK